MKKLNCIIIFLLIGHFGFSQTIINVERLTVGSDSTVYALALSYNGTRGNSATNQLNISPAVLFLRKKNEYKIFGGYALISESANQILKNGFMHLRHNYKLTNRLKTFEFYQLQFNDELLLSKREVFGVGVKYSLLAKDSLKFDINLGIMREQEVLNKVGLWPGEIAETNFYRANYTNSFKWIIGKNINVDNILYYQPYLKDFRNFRLLNDFNLTVSINKHFELINLLTLRYDSQPPGVLKKLDSAISVGLNIKFNK